MTSIRMDLTDEWTSGEISGRTVWARMGDEGPEALRPPGPPGQLDNIFIERANYHGDDPRTAGLQPLNIVPKIWSLRPQPEPERSPDAQQPPAEPYVAINDVPVANVRAVSITPIGDAWTFNDLTSMYDSMPRYELRPGPVSALVIASPDQSFPRGSVWDRLRLGQVTYRARLHAVTLEGQEMKIEFRDLSPIDGR